MRIIVLCETTCVRTRVHYPNIAALCWRTFSASNCDCFHTEFCRHFGNRKVVSLVLSSWWLMHFDFLKLFIAVSIYHDNKMSGCLAGVFTMPQFYL